MFPRSNDVCLYLTLAVSGCASSCQHCWAQGAPYPPVEYRRARETTERFREAADRREWQFAPILMNDLGTHPDALRLLEMQNRLSNPTDDEPSPFISTAHAVCRRPDAAEFLAGLRSQGFELLWTAIHGCREVHDRAVHSPGAFDCIEKLLDHASLAGIAVGANVFLTKEAVSRWKELSSLLMQRRLRSLSIETPTFYGHPRGRAFEKLRPEVADLMPIAEEIRVLDPDCPIGEDPTKCTEGHYRRHVREHPELWREWTQRIVHPSGPWVSWYPDGTVKSGGLSCEGAEIGNTTTEDTDAIVDRVERAEVNARLTEWHPVPIPLLEDWPDMCWLTDRYVDESDRHVHTLWRSAAHLWLDRWRAHLQR